MQRGSIEHEQIIYVSSNRRPADVQVQLMRGEFLETVLYWAGVVSIRLGAIAERKISQHSCVWGSVWD